MAEGGGPSPSPVKLIIDTDPGVGAWRRGGAAFGPSSSSSSSRHPPLRPRPAEPRRGAAG